MEDALLDALKCASPPVEPKKPLPNRTGAEIIAAMKAMPYKDEIEFGGSRPNNESFLELSSSVRGLLTDEEVDTLFARDQSLDCPIDFFVNGFLFDTNVPRRPYGVFPTPRS